VSAVMESIEFWHAEQVTGTTGPVPARAWGRLPYPWRECSPAVGSLLHDGLPIEWVTGQGLVSGRDTVVPLGCVRIDYRYAAAWEPPLFGATTNGLAGGNTVTEATVHALCEVMERDSTGDLVSTPEHQQGCLDLDTVQDGYCRALLDRFADAGAVLDVRYTQGRLGLHLFHAVGRSATAPFLYAGFGSHPDHRVALARAVTEAAQSRLTAIAGSRDDDEAIGRGGAPRPVSRVAPTGPPVNWADLVDTSAPTLDGDQAALAGRIARVTGVEPIRVVLPSPTGVPVVRVVAPRLRLVAHGGPVRPPGPATAAAEMPWDGPDAAVKG